MLKIHKIHKTIKNNNILKQIISANQPNIPSIHQLKYRQINFKYGE